MGRGLSLPWIRGEDTKMGSGIPKWEEEGIMNSSSQGTWGSAALGQGCYYSELEEGGRRKPRLAIKARASLE
jgi:hypothetical protein